MGILRCVFFFFLGRFFLCVCVYGVHAERTEIILTKENSFLNCSNLVG